jgi:uncharacterized protein (TIGR03083 family)
VIDTIPLMAGIHEQLMGVLRGLAPEQWLAPTACAGWTVKDVAAHLLDGHLRRLSLCRDGHPIAFPDGDPGPFLNRLNALWVDSARRLSPRLLIDLHALAAPQVLDFWRGLDPHGLAFFPVAWAGESRSEVWFDCARDFTEHWHHQQHIREAVGALSLITSEYYPTVLSILMRCVPPAYASVGAPTGTSVHLTARGTAGGSWTLARTASGWEIEPGMTPAPTTAVAMPQRDLWLLFTRKLTPRDAESRAAIAGNPELARPFFRARAIIG